MKDLAQRRAVGPVAAADGRSCAHFGILGIVTGKAQHGGEQRSQVLQAIASELGDNVTQPAHGHDLAHRWKLVCCDVKYALRRDLDGSTFCIPRKSGLMRRLSGLVERKRVSASARRGPDGFRPSSGSLRMAASHSCRDAGVTALGQLPGQEVRSEAEAGFRRHASEWWLADLYPGSSSLAHAQRSGLCSFAVSANPKRVRNV